MRWILVLLLFFLGGCTSAVESKNVDLSFSPNDKWLAVGGGVWEVSGALEIWDCSSWTLYARFGNELTNEVQHVRFASNEVVVTASGSRARRANPDDGIDVCLWSIPNKELYKKLHLRNARGFASCLDYSRADDLLVFNQWDPFGMVGIYRMRTLDKLKELPGGQHYTSIHKFAPDGKAVLACDGSEIKLFDVVTGRELARRDLRGVDAVANACFSPNCQMLAITMRGRRDVRVFTSDLGTMVLNARLDAPGGFVAFTPDSNNLAMINGNDIELMSVKNKETTQVFSDSKERPERFCFTSDGKTIAIASNSSVRVIDLTTKKTLAEFGKKSGVGKRGCP